jgi:oxaloacetate decarboxylase alpha subunit
LTLTPATNAEEIGAPLSGNIWKVMVLPHQKINEGDVLVILEAMKMETEIKTTCGYINFVRSAFE